MRLVEDRRLLDGFRRGDRGALEEVYMAYASAVAGFLRRGFTFKSGGKLCRFHGTRSEFDLEDRLQEVFLRAFGEQARMGYDGISPYKSYLLTIAKNLIIDDFRRKERALTSYSVEEVEATPAQAAEHAADPIAGELPLSGDPGRDAENSELTALVQAFVATLEGREAEVYRLRFREGLDHKLVAESTGLSPSKIKTSEKRIRLGFFEFMKRRGYFTGYAQSRSGWLRSFGRGMR